MGTAGLGWSRWDGPISSRERPGSSGACSRASWSRRGIRCARWCGPRRRRMRSAGSGLRCSTGHHGARDQLRHARRRRRVPCGGLVPGGHARQGGGPTDQRGWHAARARRDAGTRGPEGGLHQHDCCQLRHGRAVGRRVASPQGTAPQRIQPDEVGGRLRGRRPDAARRSAAGHRAAGHRVRPRRHQQHPDGNRGLPAGEDASSSGRGRRVLGARRGHRARARAGDGARERRRELHSRGRGADLHRGVRPRGTDHRHRAPRINPPPHSCAPCPR